MSRSERFRSSAEESSTCPALSGLPSPHRSTCCGLSTLRPPHRMALSPPPLRFRRDRPFWFWTVAAIWCSPPMFPGDAFPPDAQGIGRVVALRVGGEHREPPPLSWLNTAGSRVVHGHAIATHDHEVVHGRAITTVVHGHAITPSRRMGIHRHAITAGSEAESPRRRWAATPRRHDLLGAGTQKIVAARSGPGTRSNDLPGVPQIERVLAGMGGDLVLYWLDPADSCRLERSARGVRAAVVAASFPLRDKVRRVVLGIGRERSGSPAARAELVRLAARSPGHVLLAAARCWPPPREKVDVSSSSDSGAGPRLEDRCRTRFYIVLLQAGLDLDQLSPHDLRLLARFFSDSAPGTDLFAPAKSTRRHAAIGSGAAETIFLELQEAVASGAEQAMCMTVRRRLKAQIARRGLEGASETRNQQHFRADAPLSGRRRGLFQKNVVVSPGNVVVKVLAVGRGARARVPRLPWRGCLFQTVRGEEAMEFDWDGGARV